MTKFACILSFASLTAYAALNSQSIASAAPAAAETQDLESVLGTSEAICDEGIALNISRSLSDQIAKASRLDIRSAFVWTRVEEDQLNYVVRVAYDFGLSVPSYRVTLDKNTCFVLEVIYSNLEG